jgi:hypothetical protein
MRILWRPAQSRSVHRDQDALTLDRPDDFADELVSIHVVTEGSISVAGGLAMDLLGKLASPSA